MTSRTTLAALVASFAAVLTLSAVVPLGAVDRATARPYAGRALQQLEADVVVYLNHRGVPAVGWPIRYGHVTDEACDGPGVCSRAVAVFSIPGGIVVDPSLRAQFTGCYRMRGKSRARRDALGYSCDWTAHVLIHETLHGVHAETNRIPVTDEGLVDAVAADLAPGLARQWSGQAVLPSELGYPALVDQVRVRSMVACGGGQWWTACATAERRAWLVGWTPPPPEAGS